MTFSVKKKKKYAVPYALEIKKTRQKKRELFFSDELKLIMSNRVAVREEPPASQPATDHTTSLFSLFSSTGASPFLL